jgi:hypothetical protein
MKKLLYFILSLLFLSQHIVAQVPSYVPTDGLVGYWPLNGNANDESGNGNNGTVYEVILSNDRFGNENSSYFFDGIISKIYFNLNSIGNTIPSESELTTSVWIKSSDLNGALISMRGTGGIVYNFNIGTLSDIVKSPGKYGIFVRDSCCGSGNNKFGSNVVDNNWHMLTVVRYSNGSMYLYKDGQLDEVTNPGEPNELIFSPEFMTFGAEEYWVVGSQGGTCGSCNSVDEQHFNGQLDDIGIWSRALTEQEVANLYASVLSTNPIIYESNFNIYPNPTKEYLNIDFSSLESVSIFNILGKELIKESNNRINVSSLSKGVYFIKVSDGVNSTTKKFIKN